MKDPVDHKYFARVIDENVNTHVHAIEKELGEFAREWGMNRDVPQR